jgi:hypothetical protein
MELAMTLTEEHLRQIGNYIKQNFDEISSQSGFVRERSYEIQLIERVIRVEEELKSQRDLLLKQHEMMMFGFAQVDKRFDDVNKRFTMLMWAMGIGFTITTTAISLITIFVK